MSQKGNCNSAHFIKSLWSSLVFQLSELQILVMPISDLLQMVSVSTPAAASPLEENVVSPTKFKWQYPFKVCKAPRGLSLNCYFKETVD